MEPIQHDISAAPPLLPEAAVPVSADEQGGPATEPHAFSFTGTAREYFGIWIVNLFLTIITLGIYSPWAKVRKKRYFYGHTWVAGSNFEYHGNPIAILKGRIIALAILGGYYGVAQFLPSLAAVLALVMLVASPWFIVRSMAFNAFNSSYRNIRFRFQATYLQALVCVVAFLPGLLVTFFIPEFDPKSGAKPPSQLMALASLQVALLFLAYPYVVGAIRRLHIIGTQYGGAAFSCTVKIRSVYWVYFKAGLVIFGIVFVVGIISAVLIPALALMMKSPPKPDAGAGVFGLIMVLIFAAYLLIGTLSLAYTRSRIVNLFFDQTDLAGGLRFSSRLKARRLMGLYLTNLLAIMFSFGLAVPWAVIRVARYRASCLTAVSDISIDDFVAGIASQVSATGDEVGEFFNVDLSV